MFPAEDVGLTIYTGRQKAIELGGKMTNALQGTGVMDALKNNLPAVVAVKDSLAALKEVMEPLMVVLDEVKRLHPFIGGELFFIELYYYKFNEKFFGCLVAVLAFQVFQCFFHCCFSLLIFSFLSYRAYGPLK
jgi:hypothetical protein